tara:strand:- start:501 stop:812 length:312 start_codon:yes stop_codon:yes gene_type:complete
MDIPKLKGLTIVDRIKERVGKTNFVDVTKIATIPENMTLEQVIEDQKTQIEAFEKSIAWAEKSLQTETKEKETEKLIASIIFNREMIENSKNYINQLSNQDGQ